MDIGLVDELLQRGRVDDAGPQELFGERMVRAGPGGPIEGASAAIEQRRARERVAVTAQSGTREPDDAVAGTYALRQHLVALDDADRETDEVELTRCEQTRVLR